MGLIARTALQVLVRIAHMEECLDDIVERFGGLTPQARANESESNLVDPKAEMLVDLADIGVGDPEQLAAATLDRDVSSVGHRDETDRGELPRAAGQEPLVVPTQPDHPAGSGNG
jgi:hypothetical protein